MTRQRRQYGSREALETRVDYVEGNLEKAIARSDARFDETTRNFKEALALSEARFNESNRSLKEAVADLKETNKEIRLSMREMETRNQAYFVRLEMRLDKFVDKAESSRRWSIGIVVTIAIAVIGSLVTFIIFLLNNGFQA